MNGFCGLLCRPCSSGARLRGWCSTSSRWCPTRARRRSWTSTWTSWWARPSATPPSLHSAWQACFPLLYPCAFSSCFRSHQLRTQNASYYFGTGMQTLYCQELLCCHCQGGCLAVPCCANCHTNQTCPAQCLAAILSALPNLLPQPSLCVAVMLHACASHRWMVISFEYVVHCFSALYLGKRDCLIKEAAAAQPMRNSEDHSCQYCCSIFKQSQ